MFKDVKRVVRADDGRTIFTARAQEIVGEVLSDDDLHPGGLRRDEPAEA